MVAHVLYVESMAGTIYLERLSDIERCREAFEYLRDLALTSRDSIARMNYMRKHYAGSL